MTYLEYLAIAFIVNTIHVVVTGEPFFITIG